NISKAASEVAWRKPARVGMNAEPIQKADNMRRESYAHGHVTNGVFENQVPANDPGDQFAHGGVGVGVGAAGNRNHGREFGVTQCGKTANNRDEHEGNGYRGSRARTSKRR